MRHGFPSSLAPILPSMPAGLHRYQQGGGLHFVTFSCYHRLPYLGAPVARDLFENALETVRERYRLAVLAYVAMPEHVHLLWASRRAATWPRIESFWTAWKRGNEPLVPVRRSAAPAAASPGSQNRGPGARKDPRKDKD